MNGGWLSMATMRAGEQSASTRVWAPVPQPMSSTRVPGPTPGTSPRARRCVSRGRCVPGPCRGSPLNSSKNSAVMMFASAFSPCSIRSTRSISGRPVEPAETRSRPTRSAPKSRVFPVISTAPPAVAVARYTSSRGREDRTLHQPSTRTASARSMTVFMASRYRAWPRLPATASYSDKMGPTGRFRAGALPERTRAVDPRR